MQPEGACRDAIEGERRVQARCGLYQRGESQDHAQRERPIADGAAEEDHCGGATRRKPGEEVAITLLLDSAA